MKFLALFKKELREAAVWMILAALVLGLFGAFSLNVDARHRSSMRASYDAGVSRNISQYQHRSPLDHTIGLLLTCSVGLGVIIAIRQYWIPTYSRTWAFTLHRSVPRSFIYAAKLGVAILALALSVGGVWTLLFAMATDTTLFPLPPAPGIYGHGWLFPLAGLVAYLGVALSGLSTARWYTTKVAGAGFVTVIGFFALVQSSLAVAFGMLAASTVILAVQLAQSLQSREF